MIKTPLVPLKPNHKTQTVFLGLFLLAYFGLYFIIYPSNYISLTLTIYFITIDLNSLTYPITTLVLGVFVVVSFVVASSRDPGVIKQ